MLDFRYETFLTLCDSPSFTKAAELLHITQPAVSQHIKHLEEYYGCKLFSTENRKIKLTPQGELLKEYARTVLSDARHLKEYIQILQTSKEQCSFGATLSIGEYVMPEILSRWLTLDPNSKIHMSVANTQVLLDRLNHGEYDFILVEGLFDKSKYDAALLRSERFVPVCSPKSEFAKGRFAFQEILKSRLILRELGSGTREIFENILQKKNYTLHAFERITEIGNMEAIKKLVSMDLGITFLFEVAAKREIERGELCEIEILEFDEEREFNFVVMKDHFLRNRSMEFLQRLKAHSE